MVFQVHRVYRVLQENTQEESREAEEHPGLKDLQDHQGSLVVKETEEMQVFRAPLG